MGVAEAEDDGIDFTSRMKEIHEELFRLNEEANELMKEINNNFKGLELKRYQTLISGETNKKGTGA